MNGFWYKLLAWISGHCGSWMFALTARIIATGYFLFSPRVGESRRFYAALYPERGLLYHHWCSFKQYQNFTTIHLDRFLAGQAQSAACTSQGLEKLEEVLGRQGGILLMSHLGNWEMAATLLKKQREDLQLLLYMGVKKKEGVERMQKDDLRRSGVTIIGVTQEDNSPFASVAALHFLRSGGLVSIAGDMVWRNDQRKVPVTFLGRDAYLPEAPFILALLSGAPLFVFFAFRTGKNSYQCTLSEAIPLQPTSRRDRPEAIAGAAQRYADLLENALRQHPFEWYHFDRFIL